MIQTSFLCLYAIGFLIYFKKKEWTFLYWAIVEIFSLPILSLIARCPFDYEFGKLATNLTLWGQYYLVGLFLLECIRGKVRINVVASKVIIFFLIFAVYIIVVKLLFTGTLYTTPSTIRGVLYQIIPVLYAFCCPSVLPPNNQLIKLISLFLIFEFIVCILNYSGIYLFIPHYFPTMVEGQWGAYEIFESRVAGTFDRYNSLANFLTTIYIFMCIQFWSEGWKRVRVFWIVSFIVFVLIIMTGAKISLVLLAGIFLYLAVRFAKNKLLIILWFCIAVVSVLTVKNYDDAYSEETGVHRQLSGLSSFMNSSKEEDNSTISLSTYLLDNYFLDSPIFGNNLEYKGEYAYGNLTNHALMLFKADARWAFIIVDNGLVGFILYVLCFGILFHVMKKEIKRNDAWKLNLCFIYFFVLTITEPGFFDPQIFPLVILYCGYLHRKSIINETNTSHFASCRGVYVI